MGVVLVLRCRNRPNHTLACRSPEMRICSPANARSAACYHLRRFTEATMDDNRSMVRFPGSFGTALAARLDLPPGKPAAFALFAHCFTCSKDTLAASRISAALTGRGIAVLRFDFTGLGESDGDFANTNFSSNLTDL